MSHTTCWDGYQSTEELTKPMHAWATDTSTSADAVGDLDDHAPSWRPLVAQSFAEPSVSVEEFKSAFRNHPAGVAVITADPGDGPVAMTATSVFSVSAEPPLLVFSISAQSSAAPSILRADTVVVHLLGTGQLEIAKLGATSGIDRFADTSLWRRMRTGEPYFPSAHAWIRGRIANHMAAGTSTLVVVQAVETGAPPVGDPSADAGSAEPLVYHNRTWHRLGDHSKLP